MPHRNISEVIKGRSFPALTSDWSVREASILMREWRSSAVLIVKDGHLEGILTERDIVFKAIALNLDPSSTPIAVVMTRDVVSIDAERPLGHALHLMFEGGFRHVPVVNCLGVPVGIVTAQDALAIEAVTMVEELVRREEIAAIL